MTLSAIQQLDLDVHGLDGSLTDRLVAVGGLSQSKVNGLPSALTSLASDISAEETRALAAEGVLAGDIAAEESRAMAAELQLGNDLAAEAGSRISGDQVLQSAVDVVAADLAQEILDRAAAVSSAASTASSATATVASNLAAEILRAQAEEADIRFDFATADASTLASANSYTDGKMADLINSAPAMLDTLGEIATALEAEQSATASILTAISNEVTRAEAAEGLLDGRLDVLEAKQWRQAVILSASQGTTSLAKPVGAPAIPNSAADVMVFIDGRKVFYGSQFTVAAGGGSINFSSLRAQQSVEVLYFA